METAAEPLKNEVVEERIGGCTRKALDAIVRELEYSFTSSVPSEVKVYCKYDKEGEYVVRELSEKLRGQTKVLLLASNPPESRNSDCKEFTIDLSWFIDAARKPNSYLNRR